MAQRKNSNRSLRLRRLGGQATCLRRTHVADRFRLAGAARTGGLLGGAVILENVFAWPGLGTLAVTAVTNRDFPVVQGTTFFFAVILIGANLLVDISYAFLDPRIKLS